MGFIYLMRPLMYVCVCVCLSKRARVCLTDGYLWCHCDCPGPSLPQNYPGLPVCSCKACGWLNLWVEDGGGGGGLQAHLFVCAVV